MLSGMTSDPGREAIPAQPSAKYDLWRRLAASYDFGSMESGVRMKLALLAICAAAWCCSALQAQMAERGVGEPAEVQPSQAPAQQPSPAPSPMPGQAPNLATQYPTQPQGPVPITEEPHHRLVLQNTYTKVYNVTVPPLDTTLLHQHDFPYLYVILGPADIINAVQGKPELHQVMPDGEVHYSPGHFAHIARTDSGLPFHNITIELLHAQGTAKNLCKEVIPGQPTDCPKPEVVAENKSPESGADTSATGKSKSTRSKKVKRPTPAPMPARTDDDIAYFETDEVQVDLHKVSSGNDFVEATPKNDALLVALSDANLDVNLGGEHVQFLHGGDVLWLPAGQHRRVVDFLGTRSNFLLVAFKDSTPATPPQ